MLPFVKFNMDDNSWITREEPATLNLPNHCYILVVQHVNTRDIVDTVDKLAGMIAEGE